jgi:hypothetical protein
MPAAADKLQPETGERKLRRLFGRAPVLFFRVQSKRKIANHVQERASSRNVALMPGRFS